MKIKIGESFRYEKNEISPPTEGIYKESDEDELSRSLRQGAGSKEEPSGTVWLEQERKNSVLETKK